MYRMADIRAFVADGRPLTNDEANALLRHLDSITGVASRVVKRVYHLDDCALKHGSWCSCGTTDLRRMLGLE